MDNFEYSIQINDRDWEEFYSTAEECGLFQVALATEEELLLSDTEREDTIYPTASRKPKFIRVSLCPPEEEHPLAQGVQTVLPPPTPTSYRWTDPSDDVLSGSEDEEIGSVTRFLCQMEHLLCKNKEVQQRKAIPFPDEGGDHWTAIPYIDNSCVSPLGLAGHLKVQARDRTCHYGVETEHHTSNTTERYNHSATFNGEVLTIHPSNGHEVSLEAGVHTCTSMGLHSPNDLPDCKHSNKSCLSINKELQLGNNKHLNKSVSVNEICQLQQETTLPVSLGQNNQLSEEYELYHFPRIDQPEHGLYSKHNGLQRDTLENVIQDRSLQVATKAIGNSSAVQQNIPSSVAGNGDLHGSKSHSVENACNAPGNTHETSTDFYGDLAAGHVTTTYSLVPLSAAGQALQTSHPPKHLPSASCKDTDLTLPEMYDFFFDDFSDKGIAEPETNMTGKEEIMCTPDMYEYFFVEDIEHTTGKDKTMSTPDMNEYFYVEDNEHKTVKDKIMYTPDMYEYFFVEDNEESRTKKTKEKKPRQVSSTDLALAAVPSEAISWPEAYEFFFADGPQDLDRKGLMFNIPSQALSSADVLWPFVPGGLKGFSVRGTHHRRTTRLFPAQEGQEIFKEANLSTALLANIGAVSAIRYLRRRSRRARQESSPQPGDET